MKRLVRTGLVLVMTLIAALSSVSAQAAGSGLNAEQQAAAYNRHSIGLKEVSNARELGGYQTQDGRTVKFGKLLRTGKLKDASKEDQERLVNVYHLSKVIDFRSSAERLKDPDPKLDGVSAYQYSALGTGIPDLDLSSEEGRNDLIQFAKSIAGKDKDGTLVDAYYKNMYRQLYMTEDGVNAYRNFFQQLLSANGKTVLWHCSAGKDRAGNASMLLLTVLGVGKETIIQDFLNTNYYNKEDIDEAYNLVYKVTHNAKTAEDIASNYGVKREWIETSYAVINKQYGSMDNFIHNGLKLSDQDIAKLQAAYLE